MLFRGPAGEHLPPLLPEGLARLRVPLPLTALRPVGGGGGRAGAAAGGVADRGDGNSAEPLPARRECGVFVRALLTTHRRENEETPQMRVVCPP